VHAILNGVAWTPDGRYIVFDSNHQGLSTLWKAPVSGGDPEPLTVAADYAFQPTISLRQNRLAFQRFAVDSNIWKAPLFGPDHRPQTRLVASTQEDVKPMFSPDGKRIAFASRRSGSFQIYVSGTDGSNPVQLTSMKASDTGSPSWSPNGTQIAFDSRVEGHADIFIVSADGGSSRRITKEPYDNEVPTWSRNGRWIYYTSIRSGAEEIWKVPAEGGAAVQLRGAKGLGATESWDGSFVYYSRHRTLWKSDLNGTNEIRLLDLPVGEDNWCVCGKDVCFLDFTAAPLGRLIRYDPTTKREQITHLEIGPRFDGPSGMDVSPDGQWLLYTRADSLQSDIMMVENFH